MSEVRLILIVKGTILRLVQLLIIIYHEKILYIIFIPVLFGGL